MIPIPPTIIETVREIVAAAFMVVAMVGPNAATNATTDTTTTTTPPDTSTYADFWDRECVEDELVVTVVFDPFAHLPADEWDTRHDVGTLACKNADDIDRHYRD